MHILLQGDDNAVLTLLRRMAKAGKPIPTVTLFQAGNLGMSVNAIREASPLTYIVRRRWFEDDYGTDWNSPNARLDGQNKAWQYVNGQVKSNPDGKPDADQIINEPGVGRRSPDWWMGALDVFEDVGLKLCVGNYSVGRPPLPDDKPTDRDYAYRDFWKWPETWEMLARVKRNHHIMGLHEYTNTETHGAWNADESIKYIRRHELVYSYLPPESQPFLIVTEAGDEGGAHKGATWLTGNMRGLEPKLTPARKYLKGVNLWTTHHNPGTWVADDIDIWLPAVGDYLETVTILAS